jgi:15-cis-phytoene synthase
MQIDFPYCAARVREADRDRYLATLFAPAAHRDALFALYAFNVEIARVREVAREPMPGEIRLQWWREVLSGARDGEAAAHPVAAALRASMERYAILPAQLIDIIDAHSFDLYDDPMASLADLETYAVRTHSAPMALAAGILSRLGSQTDTITRHAGIAHAVAGLLTALERHASRRQIYVPLELLSRHGAGREDIFAGRATAELRAALAELRLYGRHHLATGLECLATVPATILPALLPVALVNETLGAMERADYDPFQSRSIASWRRQWLLWRAARNPRRIFQA